MENIRDVRLDFRPAKSRYSVSNPVIIRYLKAEQEAQKNAPLDHAENCKRFLNVVSGFSARQIRYCRHGSWILV